MKKVKLRHRTLHVVNSARALEINGTKDIAIFNLNGEKITIPLKRIVSIAESSFFRISYETFSYETVSCSKLQLNNPAKGFVTFTAGKRTFTHRLKDVKIL